MSAGNSVGAPEGVFRLHAKLLSHRRKVERARRVVEGWLSRSAKGYVAWSGGKDSTVVLHLVRSFNPEVPAVYFDADCAFPEVTALLGRTANVIRFPCLEPFLETLHKHTLSDERVEQATMWTTVRGVIPRLIQEHAFDACAYGLRAEESSQRRIHFATAGHIFFSKRYGVRMCQPIADWSYRDVWAYIFSEGVDYCKTYDRMWWMPEREQRISYWAGETNRSRGRYAWLKRNYPELYNRLARTIPEVSCYV